MTEEVQARQVCEDHKDTVTGVYRRFSLNPKDLPPGGRRIEVPCDCCEKLADWLVLTE